MRECALSNSWYAAFLHGATTGGTLTSRSIAAVTARHRRHSIRLQGEAAAGRGVCAQTNGYGDAGYYAQFLDFNSKGWALECSATAATEVILA
jgi:hypothetical protein